ncbi:MAG: cytochrome-c peroxidase [Aureispira sp.]
MTRSFLLCSFLVISFLACQPTPPVLTKGVDLTDIAYNPTAYTIVPPQGLPPMEVPANNPMTEEGIRLGRHLFYDPILSLDSTISCSSCHKQEKAFTDGVALSTGIDGLVGTRSSMSLINVGYSWIQGRQHNFMWDGRFVTLEELSTKGPIMDPVEMANTPENLEKTLRQHPTYPKMFREAFGINNSGAIKMEMVGKALAQFQRTLNSANSIYDQDGRVPGVFMSAQAQDGFRIFMGDANGAPSSKDGECGHCHSASSGKPLFARNDFSNNGLDSVASLTDFLDYGLGGAINDPTKNGMFKEVSLRNIALTAPYMHDGRFQTLEEVMDHYARDLRHRSPNTASELTTATTLPYLNQADKEDIIAFLHALTDTSYVNNKAWSNPFEE